MFSCSKVCNAKSLFLVYWILSIELYLEFDICNLKFPPMPWHTYILICADGTYYTGITTDLKRRIEEHNTSPRGSKYTAARRPTIVIYHEAYETRSLASKREHQIKQMSRGEKEMLWRKSSKSNSNKSKKGEA